MSRRGGRPPAYLDMLIRHAREAGVRPGEVRIVEVRHDDDCAHWGGEPCDCTPDIVSRSTPTTTADRPKTPSTVPAVRVGTGPDARLVVVRCPFCGRRHVHSDEPGHRIAHCPRELAPPEGYVLTVEGSR